MSKTKIKWSLITAILLSLSFSGFSQYAVYEPLPPIGTNPNYARQIKDGWYSASVYYQNYSTGYNTKYTLKVLVSYSRVHKIDFGNGGSVHTGMNNEGYYYIGGTLSYKRDPDYDIVSATTTVSIVDNKSSTTKFTIVIE